MASCCAVSSTLCSRYCCSLYLGSLLCDIVREYTRTNIVVLNGGGIRAPIAQGPIAAEDVLTVLPFGNDLVKLTLTGTQVREILESSASRAPGDGGFLQVSGVRFRIKSGKAVVIEAFREMGTVQAAVDGRVAR